MKYEGTRTRRAQCRPLPPRTGPSRGARLGEGGNEHNLGQRGTRLICVRRCWCEHTTIEIVTKRLIVSHGRKSPPPLVGRHELPYLAPVAAPAGRNSWPVRDAPAFFKLHSTWESYGTRPRPFLPLVLCGSCGRVAPTPTLPNGRDSAHHAERPQSAAREQPRQVRPNPAHRHLTPAHSNDTKALLTAHYSDAGRTPLRQNVRSNQSISPFLKPVHKACVCAIKLSEGQQQVAAKAPPPAHKGTRRGGRGVRRRRGGGCGRACDRRAARRGAVLWRERTQGRPHFANTGGGGHPRNEGVANYYYFFWPPVT
eukprot:gene25637-biopygen19507